MSEHKNEYAASPYYYGTIGNFGAGDSTPAEAKKYVVIQSLWTKPIMEQVDCSVGYGNTASLEKKHRMRDTLYLAALSLAYAHRSGYKVHMHTDSYGAKLLKNYGYDKLLTTLDMIPDSVPSDLFAAGKFFAMREEGRVGKVHIDIDVFLKKPGVIDKFYEDKSIDVLCQQEEDYGHLCNHKDKIQAMRAIGYPASTYPEWRGSINTGTIGFNNPSLACEYFDNYFAALNIYTKQCFEEYRKKDKGACLLFDFILEQVNLSYMSRGYNAVTLVPMHNPNVVADKIGYQHLQGPNKWSDISRQKIKAKLANISKTLYAAARKAERTL